MISPVSVLYALAMTANGAAGETRTQMEAVLGMPVEQLNPYLQAYREALPEDEKYKLSIVNSIWFTEDEAFSVKPEFLQTNADYYGAEIYKTAFDAEAVRAINAWIEENTDGMIRDMLDALSSDTVMCLINAMAFDAEWRDIYEDTQVRERVFTTEDGVEQTVDMMINSENLYLEDDHAAGFIKHYADGKYGFAPLYRHDHVGQIICFK